mmetsp:Transcript_9984/g.24862  ORF Transcript_9984/g.24862 Transcript_9984/m.24862 type:complete len:266 (+) Transcript_9984:470-1267(+)
MELLRLLFRLLLVRLVLLLLPLALQALQKEGAVAAAGVAVHPIESRLALTRFEGCASRVKLIIRARADNLAEHLIVCAPSLHTLHKQLGIQLVVRRNQTLHEVFEATLEESAELVVRDFAQRLAIAVLVDGVHPEDHGLLQLAQRADQLVLVGAPASDRLAHQIRVPRGAKVQEAAGVALELPQQVLMPSHYLDSLLVHLDVLWDVVLDLRDIALDSFDFFTQSAQELLGRLDFGRIITVEEVGRVLASEGALPPGRQCLPVFLE